MKRRNNKFLKLVFLLPFFIYVFPAFCQVKEMNDFSTAQIVVPENLSKQEQAAVKLLIEEIEKRTLIKLPSSVKLPDSKNPVIAVGILNSFKNNGGLFSQEGLQTSSKNDPEGFRIQLINGKMNAPIIAIIGNDSRGMLYGIGYFLRKITMKKNQLLVPNKISIETSPALALRGHQLGYRPKTNAYDGMDEALWEQYIRDLIVFGTNAIELMPPHTDDASDSPIFPLPPMDRRGYYIS